MSSKSWRSLAGSSRSRSVAAWFLRRPSRVGVAAAVVAVLVVVLFGRAVWMSAQGAREATWMQGQRSSCEGAVRGFAVDFFGPDRSDWPGSVARWVEPQLRAGVSAIDPDQVPVGTPVIEATAGQVPRCDVWLRVTPDGGQGVTPRVRVTAVQQLRGDWLVQSWEPVDNPVTAPDGDGPVEGGS